MIYTAEINVRIVKENVASTVKDVINILDFEPFRMVISYHEFKKPREYIKYNYKLLIDELEDTNFSGIVCVTLYDKDYHPDDVTPFFRFDIGEIKGDNSGIMCLFEWISYPNLNHLIYENKAIYSIFSGQDLAYCHYYNQSDAFYQSKADGNQNWGKSSEVWGVKFIAAPLMYFGKSYDRIIPLNVVKANKNADVITINNVEIIKISLFDLYDDPSKRTNRKKQKSYWKDMSLDYYIEKYERENRLTMEEYLQRRAELKKSMKKK